MRIFLFLFFSLTIMTLHAQLVNQGGTITVKSGATLVVESNLTNTTGSIVLESGATLEITGNFTNQATMNFNDASEVIFTGTSNSQVTSNGGTFGNVRVDKTSANVVLADDMIINGQLNFAGTNAKVELGSNDLTLGSSASFTGDDSDEYVVADGTGQMIKHIAGTGSVTYPVGDATSYSPLTANVTAGTFGPSAQVGVKLTDSAHPSKYADATEYITRYWEVSNSDITGYAATLSGTYADGDVTGSDESLIFGTTLDGADWVYTNSTSNPGTNTIGVDVGDDASAVLFGQNKFGKLTIDALLQGSYTGGASPMKTTLNSKGLIPTISPYDSNVSVTSIPNTDIVDWIKIEARDQSNPATVLKSYSCFLDKNGNIVGLDGSNDPFFKDAPSDAYLTVWHRNHLGVRTKDPINWYNGVSFNFADPSNQSNVYTNTGYSNGPQVSVGGGSAYAMWGGNADGNTTVRFSGGSNDRDYLLGTVLSGNKSTILNNVYSLGDLNMDGIVRFSASSNDRDYLLGTVLSGNKSTIIRQH